MQKSNLIYLEHILQNLYKVLKNMDGVSYHDFIRDEEKQDAVVRKIE